MNTVEERLSMLFGNPEFLEKNADKGTMDEIYAAVSAEMPDVTREEMETFLISVSKSMDVGEVSEEALDNVSGGISFLAACAAVAGVGAAVSVCYKGGKAIGQAIYYLTH